MEYKLSGGWRNCMSYNYSNCYHLHQMPTQLAMILDGSGSISSGDWNLMKEGLARSIENSSIFPHDGNVELTVIQFGRRLKRQIELRPTVVTKNNYAHIGT